MSGYLIPGLLAIVAVVIGLMVIKRLTRRTTPPIISGPMERHKHRTHEQAEDIAEHLPELEIAGKVEGGPKEKIGDIVEEHPDEALGVIRRWLHNRNNK